MGNEMIKMRQSPTVTKMLTSYEAMPNIAYD